MKRTTKYQLGYFEEGDITSSTIEMQRWETLDAQLYAVYSILGNGVISGWDILPSSGLSIVVAEGSGHVNFVAVSSSSNTVLSGLTPSIRNYIYAVLTTSSYWDNTVAFSAKATLDSTTGVYLGYVDTDATTITDVNTDNRTYLSFVNLITSLVKSHRHIGGDDNPPPVNLASEVQGIINQNNLPDLDASIIQTGTLDSDRLPLIDHITKLINQGTLTHAQLDSFVEALSIQNSTLMGETSTIDLLQLVLALKHIYPDIDRYLINEIAYIPGISPDTYVDWVNTTADVDIRPYSEGGQHTITGLPAPAKKAYTYTWDSETEFEASTSSNITISGDQVSLATEENKLVIDEFSDLSQWTVVTEDLSSASITLAKDTSTYVEPPNSAKLVVGDQTVEISLIIKKEFDARDWSSYGKIVFFLKTDSVQHGDVYFYINDAIAGTQNSHTKVLNRNEPTVNIDTLQNGWQEITIDISDYTRTNVNLIGFYVSSQDGWDTSKGFDLNIDNVYLTTGVIYKEEGYLRVIFGNDTLYDFWRVRWNASVPTDSQSAGVNLKYRTRVGNTIADLNQAIWSVYSSVSGTDISLPAPNLYKYIQIEMFFDASTDFTRSVILHKLFLDYYISDIDGSFNYETKDDWDSGDKFNIDTSTVPNSMLISNTNEVNDIIYGSNGAAYQLDDNLVQLYNITGSLLPRSTYQVLNDISPSLGLVTGVARGNNGNIWMTDVDNDRILELDKSGALITGFYGSFLNVPVDSYGTEDAGPGSNIVEASQINSTSTTTTLALGTSLGVLQAIYNSEQGVLYVVFDKNLENIYSSSTKLDINKIYVVIGAQRFYLQDSTVELLGVDEVKYNDWYALSTSSGDSAQFIGQFSFDSHVLKITLLGADKTLLNYMVNQLAPSIVISSPYEQQITTTSPTINFLIYNFTLGTQSGENGVRVTLDGGVPQMVYANQVTYTGLAIGKHTIIAQLIDGNGDPNTNIEATATGSFIVYSGTYSLPIVSLNTPKPNQIYSASPVVIDFNVDNFPILATGQHIRYVIDANSPIDYYLESPITISDLTNGEHTVTMYLVDKWGNDLGYTYGTVTGTFIVGTNSNAVTKLYVDAGAIYDSSLEITNNTERINVDVGNIYFANIYSPIDIQVVAAETGSINPSGLPTVVIAKLRSPSWTDGLSDTAHATEMARRIAASVNTASNTSSTVVVYPTIPTAELIYGTRYLDGHSVVQMSMDGSVVFSNNAAIFAETKDEAKSLLGSAEKLGETELLIADSCNKRALITCANVSSQMSQIEWQFDSNRYISDFHIVTQDDVVVSVGDDAISESSVFVRQGTNIIWENNSVSPISIYSGSTSYDQFQLDPDLTLYGDVFFSTTLQPGDRYTFKMVTVGEYPWFVYPSILIGNITVTRNRISSRDQFLILENDNLESPFSSRVIRVDAWGNVMWVFGEGYLVKPRDARPLLNNRVIISS
jgi:hypothetical protein